MSNLSRLSEKMSNLLMIDEKIKKINDQNKYLKKERDEIEIEIFNFLKANNLQNKKFNINGKSLFLNKSSTLYPLNINLISEILSKHVDQNKKNNILRDIDYFRNKNKKETIKIKRKNQKKSIKSK